jgi:hypothetical protein
MHAVHVPASGPVEPALVKLVKAELPTGELEFVGQAMHVEVAQKAAMLKNKFALIRNELDDTKAALEKDEYEPERREIQKGVQEVVHLCPVYTWTSRRPLYLPAINEETFVVHETPSSSQVMKRRVAI